MSDPKIQPKDTALVPLVAVLERAKPQMKAALPAALARHLTPDRMIRLVTTTLRRTPKLQECSPISLAGAVIQACQLGLEVDGVLGEFWLTPRQIHGQWEVVGIPGFRGLMKLAMQSGQVDWILPHAVYAGDEFIYEYGSDPKLIHKPGPGPREVQAIVAAYAVARLRSQGTVFWVMPRSEVDKVRAMSSARDGGPWVTHYTEMAQKTAIRRLCKFLPSSTALGRAVVLDELAEAGLSQGLDAIVDAKELGLSADRTVLDTIGEALDGKRKEGDISAPPSNVSPPGVVEPAQRNGSTTPEAPKQGANDAVTPPTPPPTWAEGAPVSGQKPPRTPRKRKWPKEVEQPVRTEAAPISVPVPVHPEEVITSANLFTLLGTSVTLDGLDALAELIYVSAVYLKSQEGQKAVIRQAVAKQRARLTPSA